VKATDPAAASAMMPPSPGSEFNTADHTHVSVSVTDPRRCSFTKTIIFELQQTVQQQTVIFVF